MENERMIFNLAQGQNEVVIREGRAPEQLPILAPIKTNIVGTIGCVAEYLTKRLDKEQFQPENCHIIVNRENVSISLVTNESDAYKRGSVVGKIQYHPAFYNFGINRHKVWTPVELGLHCKMNRTFFADRSVNMKLVSDLMHFTATINSSMDHQIQENGSRSDNFSQVVNSNLPASFQLNIPIFKGDQPEIIEVETFAQIEGRTVEFMLISPGAQEAFEAIRDKKIDEQLAIIREVAPDIAIIEE